MNKDVLRFFKNLLIFAVIMFIVDRGVGSILEYYFKKQPMGDDAAFAHALDNPTEDILFYGSSRAVHTYDCRIFTDSLGLSAYNCGRNASNIIYHAAIISAAFQKSTPKAVVLDISPKELSWKSGQGGDDVLSAMILPYITTNKNFEALAKELFPKELIKAKISKLYTYNSMIASIIRNSNRTHNDNINGYQPLHGTNVDEGPKLVDAAKSEVSAFAAEKLEYFVKTVTDHHVPLIVIMSPIYALPAPPTPSMIETKKILDKYHVQLWDYAFDSAFIKKEYFYDLVHLNAKGGDLFSSLIASRMKEMGIVNKDSVLNESKKANELK
ncbi:MAG: hypothetical protein JSS67_00470 [Bacteroidetes bacterium]|nr:hypothetical protein [Bacteroidota bacterium]